MTTWTKRDRTAAEEPISPPSTCRTTSWSPTETPPLSTTRSAPAAAASSPAAKLPGSSGRTEAATTSAPILISCPAMKVPFDSWIWPRASTAPAGRSSSPVAMTATRGRRTTVTSPRPQAAAVPRDRGPSRSPAGSTSAPAEKSSPAALTWFFSPGSSTIRTIPPDSSVSSTGTTASACDGRGAPVMIRTHSPGAIAGSSGEPAATVPTTLSSAPRCRSVSWTAKPSMAEFANTGTAAAAVTGAASVRPSARPRGTVSTSVIRVTSRSSSSRYSSMLSLSRTSTPPGKR